MVNSTQPTIGELFKLPEAVHRGDFVLNLADVARPDGVPDEVLETYVVTDQLERAFGEALSFIRQAVVSHKSKGTYLHGSFGSGKSHFMAVLYQLLSQDPRARAKPELQDVCASHAWLDGKKFLLVPYHFLTQSSLETCLLGGYVNFVSRLHPGCTLPAVYLSDRILKNAEDIRQKMNDEAFLALLGTSSEDSTDDDGWGDLAEAESAAWTLERYQTALSADPRSQEKQELVTAVIQNVLTAYQETIGHLSESFVPLDDGLTAIAEHAKTLGYDGLILFCDELILWLASRAADVGFVQREVQKMIKLVEGQARAIPIISFIAQQRDLRELVGDQLMGHEQSILDDCFKHWEGRFDTISLEDRNLPEIAARRVLVARSSNTRELIDKAFTETLQRNPQIKETLLAQTGTEDAFRKLYPFSPALIETLVAVSSILQRERTALKVLMELLIEKRDSHRLGDLIPVGDLYQQVAEGAEAFSPTVKARFEKAQRFYLNEFLPYLEEQIGIKWKQKPQTPEEEGMRARFDTQDRLMKTLLIAALTPEVPVLKGLTVRRLMALNHGVIQAPFAGGETAQLNTILKSWAAQFGQLKITDDREPQVFLQLSGVDIEPLLAEVAREDNGGNRRRAIRRLLFQALELDPESDTQNLNLVWRGVKRRSKVSFANIRDLELDQMQNESEEWLVLIDYPFDRDNHVPREDILRLDAYRKSNLPPSRVIAWMPTFFSEKTVGQLGDLVKIEHLLSGSRFQEVAKHLTTTDRAEAAKMLKSRRDHLRESLQRTLQMAYGIVPETDQALHPDKRLAKEERFASLWEGYQPSPPVATGLRDALEKLLVSAFEYQYPAAPMIGREVRSNHLSALWEELETFAGSADERHLVENRDRRQLLNQVAEPLKLGSMQETHWLGSSFWLDRLDRAVDGLKGEASVSDLDQALEQDGATGLSRGLRDLILLFWAVKTHHAFRRDGQALEDAQPGSLAPRDTVYEVNLPSEEEWQEARHRASKLFGIQVLEIRNPSNVSSLASRLREKANQLAPRLSTYNSALQSLCNDLGVNEKDRRRTCRELLTLLEAVREAASPTGSVRAFATEKLTASLGACQYLLQRLDANLSHLTNSFVGEFLRELAQSDSGKESLQPLTEALGKDEVVVPLAERFEKVVQTMKKSVTKTVPAQPEPRKQQDTEEKLQVAESATTRVDDLDDLFSKIRESASTHNGRIRVHWEFLD